MSAALETIRLHQANERTMLAWLRTGIALMAFGFAIARFGLFLRQIALAGAVAPRATHSLGSAWLANILATFRYASVRRAIERGDVGAPSAMLVYVMGATASLVGIVMTTLLVRALAE
jgi:putative membrane protein